MATQKTKDGNPTAATTAPRQMLQVIAKRDGFRRAGREWSGTTTVPLDELTKEQVEQLQAEPQLVTQLWVEAIVDTQD